MILCGSRQDGGGLRFPFQRTPHPPFPHFCVFRAVAISVQFKGFMGTFRLSWYLAVSHYLPPNGGTKWGTSRPSHF